MVSEGDARRWRIVQAGVLLGLVGAGGLALRPVRAPEVDPQPLLQRASLLRQAVAREPENPVLLLQLARAEFAAAQLAAMRDYSARFPEVVPEPLEEQRLRYEAWLRGYLWAAPEARRAFVLAQRAARHAPAGTLRSDALLLAGSIAWHRGDERGALGYFRQACRADPRSLPAWRRLGAAAAELGHGSLHALAMKKLAALQPPTEADDPPGTVSAGLPPIPPGGDGAPAPLPSTRP